MKKLDMYNVGDLVAINNYIGRYEEANEKLKIGDFNLDFLFNIADNVDKGFFVKNFGIITGMVLDGGVSKYVINNENYTQDGLFILDDANDGINILNYINYSGRN